MRKLAVIAALFAALPLLSLPLAAQDPPAQTQDPKPQPPVMEKPGMAQDSDTPAPKIKVKPAPKKAVDPNGGKTVEEIIARVNNEIITRSEYDHALATAADDAKQQCQSHCTPEQLANAVDDIQKHALRQLIDQSLLAQRGKDMGISVEADVIKKLDQIRIENQIPSMEELEKKVAAEGLNYEDFKNNIRTGILTQRVISSEVGSHITITNEDIQKYYDSHKAEFARPEQVALRSIEVNIAGKKPEELADLRKKADTTLKRIQDGEDFAEMAKRFSDGSTAKQGGYLGIYKRGELSKELEDKVFVMKKNQLTEVMETKQGYLILQVLEHYDEGEQALDKVEDEIRDKLYGERMEPALREYLKTLREQSYVVIKPGYQDVAGSGNSEIQEVSATPEVTKSKKGHKKYLLFGKRGSADSGN
jgi:peptidyl-prolyl cis-trans isomerase SurA